jgi:hypothetical protein
MGVYSTVVISDFTSFLAGRANKQRTLVRTPGYISLDVGLWHTALVQAWKVFVILNASSVVGAFLAIFMVPGSTPLWMWAVCSVGTIAILNFVAYKRIRRRSQ